MNLDLTPSLCNVEADFSGDHLGGPTGSEALFKVQTKVLSYWFRGLIHPLDFILNIITSRFVFGKVSSAANARDLYMVIK